MARNTKVLVVDDDPDILSATRVMLGNRGYDVLTASGPDEGMRLAEEKRPDVVLLDIMMPEGTEGFQWVWRLRRHSDESLRSIPVIVVTCLHETTPFRFHPGDSDETGDYLPVQGFFDKPADPDVLAEKIEAVLQDRK